LLHSLIGDLQNFLCLQKLWGGLLDSVVVIFPQVSIYSRQKMKAENFLMRASFFFPITVLAILFCLVLIIHKRAWLRAFEPYYKLDCGTSRKKSSHIVDIVRLMLNPSICSHFLPILFAHLFGKIDFFLLFCAPFGGKNLLLSKCVSKVVEERSQSVFSIVDIDGFNMRLTICCITRTPLTLYLIDLTPRENSGFTGSFYRVCNLGREQGGAKSTFCGNL